MTEVRIVVLGGCHVAGYPLGQEQAFTTQLDHLTAGGVVRQLAHVSFSRLPRHLGLIDELQPSHVVLQLGNFEFSNSARQLLKQAHLREVPKASQSQDTASTLLTEPRLAWVRTAGLSLLLLLLWYSGRLQTRSLRALQEYMRQHPQVVFVMMTPLPSLNSTLNMVRRLGGWLMRRQLAAPNCYWLDSHQLLQPAKSLFADPLHLNACGHQVLAYGLAAVLTSTAAAHSEQAAASIFAD